MLLIFDWDGTLINSMEKIIQCMRAAILEIHLPDRTDAQIRNTIGLELSKGIAQLFDDIDDSTNAQLKQAYSRQFIQADQMPCSLYPGVMESLEHLKSDGHMLALATGKSRAGLNRVLKSLQLDTFFDITRCADESRSKPDPLMLQQILSELTMLPVDAVMVGDTEYDLNMANNAAMESVAVSYGAHDVNRLLACGPAHTIDQFPQLVEWVQYRT